MQGCHRNVGDWSRFRAAPITSNLSQVQREPLIPGPRAWAMAEAEGRTLRPEQGRPTKEVVESRRLILDPRKHFSPMFGVSPDYAYFARGAGL